MPYFRKWNHMDKFDKFMRDLENIGVLHGWEDFMEDSAESTDEEQESKE